MNSAHQIKYDTEWEASQIESAIDYYCGFFDMAERFNLDTRYLESKIAELEHRITQLHTV